MRHRIPLRFVSSLCFALLLVSGCGANRTPATAPTNAVVLSTATVVAPTTTAIPPTPTEEETIIATDCGWSRDIRAWNDVNANGKWDIDEQPLAGVTIAVTSTAIMLNPSIEQTDQTGTTQWFVLLGGCPDARFEVGVETPQGYRPTTPTSIKSDPTKDKEKLDFGFVKQ